MSHSADKQVQTSAQATRTSPVDIRLAAGLSWCGANGVDRLTVAVPFSIAEPDALNLIRHASVISVILMDPLAKFTDKRRVGSFQPNDYSWQLPELTGEHILFIGGRNEITSRMIRSALTTRVASFVYWDLDRWVRKRTVSLAAYKVAGKIESIGQVSVQHLKRRLAFFSPGTVRDRWSNGRDRVSIIVRIADRAALRLNALGKAVALTSMRTEAAVRYRVGSVGKPSGTANEYRTASYSELQSSNLVVAYLLQSPSAYRLNRLLSDASKDLRLRERVDPNRVVMACPTLVAGGAERQLTNTAVALREKLGVEVTVLVSRLSFPVGNDFFRSRLTEAGVDVLEVQSATSSTEAWRKHQTAAASGAVQQLRRLVAGLPPELSQEVVNIYLTLRSRRPSVVHAWLDHSCISAGLAALIAGIPRVILSGRNVSPLHFDYILQPYMRAAYRAMAKREETVFVNNSRGGALDYSAWLGVEPNRFAVIYNGIALGSHNGSEEERKRQLRRSYRIPDSAVLIGGMFRLSAEKRPVLWVETFSEVCRERPEVFGLIFGAGRLEPELRAHIEERGLTDRVIVAPPVRDNFTALASFDVLLLTSLWEGTPNVAVEAQWVQTPVVLTGGGGAEEAVANERTGIYVQDSGAASLAAAVLRLVDDQLLRKRLGENGPAFVQRRFGLNRMLSETIRSYGFPPECLDSSAC